MLVQSSIFWSGDRSLILCSSVQIEKNFNFLKRGKIFQIPLLFSQPSQSWSFSMATSYLILSRSYNGKWSFPTTRMDWLPSNDICDRPPNLFGDGIFTEGMLNENVMKTSWKRRFFQRGVAQSMEQYFFSIGPLSHISGLYLGAVFANARALNWLTAPKYKPPIWGRGALAIVSFFLMAVI